jgi:hypothetical protein
MVRKIPAIFPWDYETAPGLDKISWDTGTQLQLTADDTGTGNNQFHK